MTVAPVSSYDAERSRIEVRVDDEPAAWVDLRPGHDHRAHRGRSGTWRSGPRAGPVRAAVEHIAGKAKPVIAVCPCAPSKFIADPDETVFGRIEALDPAARGPYRSGR